MSKFFTSCLLCAVLFATPIALFLGPKTEILPDERRKAIPFPEIPEKIRSRSIKNFFYQFDLFFADQFPFRAALLDLSLRSYEAVGDNPDAGKSYQGKDGWLFLGNKFNRCVDKLQGQGAIPDKRLRQFVKYYTKMSNAVRSSGGEFVIIVGPNKASVYPEYLPDVISLAPQRYIDPLIEKLRAAGVKVYDPKDRLMAKKSEGLLYYKRDTHWNSRGAYEAFAGAREYLGLPPLPPLTFVEGPEARGDLVDTGGFKKIPITAGDNPQPQWTDPSTPPLSGKTAWIFSDSFGHPFAPYMNKSFVTWKLFSRQTDDFMKELETAEEKPDLVLWVIVERFFGDEL